MSAPAPLSTPVKFLSIKIVSGHEMSNWGLDLEVKFGQFVSGGKLD